MNMALQVDEYRLMPKGKLKTTNAWILTTLPLQWHGHWSICISLRFQRHIRHELPNSLHDCIDSIDFCSRASICGLISGTGVRWSLPTVTLLYKRIAVVSDNVCTAGLVNIIVYLYLNRSKRSEFLTVVGLMVSGLLVSYGYWSSIKQ